MKSKIKSSNKKYKKNNNITHKKNSKISKLSKLSKNMKGGADTQYLTELWKIEENKFGAQVTIIKDPATTAATTAASTAAGTPPAPTVATPAATPVATPAAAPAPAPAPAATAKATSSAAAAAAEAAAEAAAKAAEAAAKAAEEEEEAKQILSKLNFYFNKDYGYLYQFSLDFPIFAKKDLIIMKQPNQLKYKEEWEKIIEINNTIIEKINNLIKISSMTNPNEIIETGKIIFQFFGEVDLTQYNLSRNVADIPGILPTDTEYERLKKKRKQIRDTFDNVPKYNTISLPESA